MPLEGKGSAWHRARAWRYLLILNKHPRVYQNTGSPYRYKM